MRVVVGVLVVAVNSLLLVEAAWVGGAPAVRLARHMGSLVTEEIKPCGNQGQNLFHVQPTKAKRNKDGDFMISTEVMTKIPWDDNLTVEFISRLKDGKTKTPPIKMKLRNCEEMVSSGKETVENIMKAANVEFTGCPIRAGNYSVDGWVSQIPVPPFARNNAKLETKVKFSSNGNEVGCFKAMSKLKRQESFW